MGTKAATVKKGSAPASKHVTKDEIAGQANAILQNMMSLLTELGSELGATPPQGDQAPVQDEADTGDRSEMPAAPVQKPKEDFSDATKEEEEEDDDEEYELKTPGGESHVVRLKKSAAKALITGNPDASTGNSSAEDRQKDEPEWDEENVDEITKGFMRMLGKSAGVRRSAQAPATAQDIMLLNMAKTMQEVTKQVKTLSQINEDILEGLGVAKGLEQAPSQTPQRKPVQSNDMAMVAKEFMQAVVAAAGGQGSNANFDPSASPAENVRKSVAQIPEALKQLSSLWAD